ncbi:hypothetical protein, partial [Acinetobacter baumannii]|uniref:hypothetical protein n=1 Tax=Acinetobacter baumannii TaxID=470 RepID=UPI003B8419B2
MINEVFFISTSLIEFQRPAGTLFVLPVKLRFYCFLDKKIGAVVDKVKYPSNPTVFRAVVLDSHS